MSSGQKDWQEELESESLRQHVERIDAMPSLQIVASVEKLRDAMRHLITADLSLAKHKWNILDEMQQELDKLS